VIIFPCIITAIIWRFSKDKQRVSERIVFKLEREKSKSGRSHQMTAAIIRAKTADDRRQRLSQVVAIIRAAIVRGKTVAKEPKQIENLETSSNLLFKV
jgi:hypothetical protein